MLEAALLICCWPGMPLSPAAPARSPAERCPPCPRRNNSQPCPLPTLQVWLVKLEDVDSPEEAALLRGHTLLVPASARPPLEDEDEFYVTVGRPAASNDSACSASSTVHSASCIALHAVPGLTWLHTDSIPSSPLPHPYQSHTLALPPPQTQDLVGLRVFLQATGEEVGRVAEVFDGTGTHDVMRIQLAPAQLQRLATAGMLQGSGSDGGSSSGDEGSSGSAAEEEDGELPPHHVFLPFAKALVPVVDLEGGRMEVTPPPGLLDLAAPSSMRRARRENRGRRDRRRQRPRVRGTGGDATASTEGSSDAS